MHKGNGQAVNIKLAGGGGDSQRPFLPYFGVPNQFLFIYGKCLFFFFAMKNIKSDFAHPDIEGRQC